MISRIHTLMVDVPVTKRKSFSFVLDAEGEVLFTSPNASGAFEWLILNEFLHIILKTPRAEMTLFLDEVNLTGREMS